MWPTRSRTSHSVQRVWTFQFLGSSTRSKNFFWSRRRTSRTVSFPSAAIGLTGAISALISAFVLPEVRLRPPETGSKFCAARRGGRYDDRRKVEVQLLAPPFVLGRQLKGRAERLGRLVHGEPGLVGCDLEEHAARLPVVDRAKVLAVDHRRDLATGRDKDVAPGQLLAIVGGPPGDVVHRPHRLLSRGCIRGFQHIDQRTRPSSAGLEARAAVLATGWTESHRVAEKAD